MVARSEAHTRYALSFTIGALLAREAVIATSLYLEVRNWGTVRKQLQAENLFQARAASSGARLGREVVQRLSVLTDVELELLHEAVPSERGHLMWIAACRRYGLIGDFAEEVVRERFLLLTPTLCYDDFDRFVHGKTLWHPELAEVRDSTLRKLRSTVFQMLTEAGLLSEGEIVPVTLSERAREALGAQLPSDVLFLPTRDNLEDTL